MNKWEELISSGDETDGYLRTDEFEDVHASLTLLRGVLERILEEPALWKWAVIAGHSALQGACVCILTQTDGLGALTDKSTRELTEKLYGETDRGRKMDEDSVAWPEERIAELPELLKRLPGELKVSLPGRNARSYGYELPGDLRRLHEFRNKFTHFASISWSIQIAGLPRIIGRAVDLTRRIVESDDDYSRFNHFQELGMKSLFADISDRIKSLERT
jgi:hypothetical protein